ncbi:MAG: 4Fe-4S dicluster domain-containing protein [Armatimonadota bacterium]
MSDKPLLLTDLRKLAEALIGSGVGVIAPAPGPGPLRFRRIDDASEITLPQVNTQIPPKEHLFPPTEPLLYFRFRGTDVELSDPPASTNPTTILGVRPCDAAGTALMDAVFLADPPDPFYAARRQACTVVTVACTQTRDTCFCTAVGLSPHSTLGSDLVLFPVPEGYIAQAMTDKGKSLVEAHSTLFSATDMTPPAPPSLARTGPLAEAHERLANTFNSPKWQEIAQRCLGCGACASVCPTCHCFDILDDTTARGGVRIRCWDACGLELFTRHASGHNPRPNQPARFRQRVLHKFAYSVKSVGRPLCVGCGRCIDHCPVGMDVYNAAVSLTQTG